MKRYSIDQPGQLGVHDTPVPVPGPEEVLIRVSHISICGSDVHLFKGTYSGPHSYPVLFGHEWSGTVEAAGRNVDRFRNGDKVTGDCSRFCGSCSLCERDRNLCQTIEKFGITVDGASAEYIVRDQKYLYRADERADLLLLSLTEPISVAAHLLSKIERINPDMGKGRILVLGGGGIGLAALILLRYRYGAGQVDLFDISPLRRDRAASLGASVLDCSPFSESPGKTGGEGAQGASGGQGTHGTAGSGGTYSDLYRGSRYDLVIETTGNREVFRNTFSVAAPLGIIGCLGMIPEVSINQKAVVMKGLTVVGSIGGTGEFPVVMDFIMEYPDDVRKIVSHVMPISQAPSALELSRDAEKAVKVSLSFGNGG